MPTPPDEPIQPPDHAAAIKRMTVEEIKNNANNLRDKNFTPANHSEKGYVLRGSISTTVTAYGY
ncbi:hypothetical protein BGW42_004898 [Actinomortierella wolfii]|nr:hypothetical protein BGW42_004898 [Actinomortierella wolfii]